MRVENKGVTEKLRGVRLAQVNVKNKFFFFKRKEDLFIISEEVILQSQVSNH